MRCRKSEKVSRRASPISSQVGRRQRLGGDHQRVDRDARPPVPGQLRGEALGRADHRPGAHHAVLGAHLARGDRRDPGPLVDRHAAAFGGPRQPAHQSRRVDGRAVGGVRRARDAVGAHDLGSPPRRRGAPGRPRPGPSAAPPRPRPGPARAGPAPRASRIVPPLATCASMPSAPATRATSSTVARIAACWASAASRPPSAASAGSSAGNSAEHQPPLRPDAPKPATSDSSTRSDSDGSGLGQVVGGPEPGVAGPDDGHVDVEVAGQGRSRRPVLAGALVPERQAVVRLAAPLSGLPTSRSACAA